MIDTLVGKVGKSRSDSMGWEYILAHGPVGASLYPTSEIRDDGTAGRLGAKIVPLQRLEPYDLYDSLDIAMCRGRRSRPTW